MLCSECAAKYVLSKSIKLPDRFSHYKKTEYTPECDRRVGGYSEMNLYERVGLPIYLTVRPDTQFCLNIGFPAVGGQMLLEAFRQSVQVFITGADCQRKIPVDTVHFIEDHITLIPINFIPDAGKNYTVIITPDEKVVMLREKWPAYADGFGYGGAILRYQF